MERLGCDRHEEEMEAVDLGGGVENPAYKVGVHGKE